MPAQLAAQTRHRLPDPFIRLFMPKFYLRTLGTLALEHPAGSAAAGMRKKDLALLAFLSLNGQRRHARSRLAGLLWGDATEERARHSLSQAVGRLDRTLGKASIDAAGGFVELRAVLEGDALMLLDGVPADELDYGGDFLAGFAPGRGAEEFESWADGMRATLRGRALLLLDSAGGEAQDREEWRRSLTLAERAVHIDPLWEEGHRRIIRALHRLGETPSAIRHFDRHAAWLLRELGTACEPATARLAESLRERSRLVAPAAVAIDSADDPDSSAGAETGLWVAPAGESAPLVPSPTPLSEENSAAPAEGEDEKPGGSRLRPSQLAGIATTGMVIGLWIGMSAGSGADRAASSADATGSSCAPGFAVAQFAGETFTDNIPVRPRERFVKAWTIKNSGECAWTTEYLFQREFGDLRAPGLPTRLPLRRIVPPGDTYTISLPVQAPAAPGRYNEHWSLRDSEGGYVQVSGSNTVWAKIIVPGPRAPFCTAANAVAKLASENYPDDVVLPAGAPFIKRWTLRNSGQCAWPPSFTLRFAESRNDRTSLLDHVRMGRQVEPGEEQTLSVPMRAPSKPGDYREDWSLHDLRGDTIRVSGSRTIWAQFVVDGP